MCGLLIVSAPVGSSKLHRQKLSDESFGLRLRCCVSKQTFAVVQDCIDEWSSDFQGNRKDIFFFSFLFHFFLGSKILRTSKMFAFVQIQDLFKGLVSVLKCNRSCGQKGSFSTRSHFFFVCCVWWCEMLVSADGFIKTQSWNLQAPTRGAGCTDEEGASIVDGSGMAQLFARAAGE